MWCVFVWRPEHTGQREGGGIFMTLCSTSAAAVFPPTPSQDCVLTHPGLLLDGSFGTHERTEHSLDLVDTRGISSAWRTRVVRGRVCETAWYDRGQSLPAQHFTILVVLLILVQKVTHRKLLVRGRERYHRRGGAAPGGGGGGGGHRCRGGRTSARDNSSHTTSCTAAKAEGVHARWWGERRTRGAEKDVPLHSPLT